MGDHRSSIDLTTMEEVHRLLRDTEFATAADLAKAGGAGELALALDTARPATRAAQAGPSAQGDHAADPSGLSPLPRRR